MNLLTEIEKSKLLVALESKMSDFVDDIPDDYNLGFLPDNISELMAKAALNVLETVVDCNIYFEENAVRV